MTTLIDENPDISRVVLSREQLLHITSLELEDFAKRLSIVKELSHAEEKELKRQRRLVKNRESAQASRERKKQTLEELEAQMRLLNQENNLLQSKVNELQSENRSLRYVLHF